MGAAVLEPELAEGLAEADAAGALSEGREDTLLPGRIWFCPSVTTS
jgi:hypothetical protein